MGITEICILAIGLAMDAFAVSICKGLCTAKLKTKHMAIVGMWFGGFQALMPVIGYLIGKTLADYIKNIDHWIAFGLLVIIGINMIQESMEEEEISCEKNAYGLKTMLVMAIATSIDALAVGVTFAFLGVNIIIAATIIGIITFILSAIGIKIGNIFGSKYKAKAEKIGGIILILMGLKILIEHLFM